MERRELPLDFIFHGKVQLRRLVGLAMAQNGSRFAWIVIAVVIEKNNLSANFTPQPPGRQDFCKQKSLREKPARLLAETDDGWVAHRFAARAGFLTTDGHGWARITKANAEAQRGGAATKGARTALSAGFWRAGRDSRTRLSALRENLRRTRRCWEIALQRPQRGA